MKNELIFAAGQSAPRGAYSPAVKVDLGAAILLFVTGQRALDPERRPVAPFDATQQTETIFGLLRKILEAAGMTLADVVRAQTYLTNMVDYENFTAVRDRFLTGIRPASTLREVKGLAHRGYCAEIEVTAIKPNPTP